ncbi:hypothetical protein F441_00242, partial [Phytophthora nicotianae CJ01A1]
SERFTPLLFPSSVSMKFSLSLTLMAIVPISAATAGSDCSYKCPNDVDIPTCGSDGHTYPSFCKLNLTACETNTNITMVHDGPCGTISETSPPGTYDCPDLCPEIYNPVTDENGVEYANKCFMNIAKCEGSTDTGAPIDISEP